MLKILQPRIQQYMNQELPEVQTEFRKGRGTRGQIANIYWVMEKQESSKITSTSALLTILKFLTVWIITNSRKFLKIWEYQPPYMPSEKAFCRSRLLGETSITSDMQMILPLWQKAKRN